MYPTFQKHCTQKYSQSIVRSESICWKIYGREKLSFIKRGKKIKGVFWQWMAVCLQLLHFLRREKKFYTADSSLFLFPIWWRTNTPIHFRNRRGVWVLGFGIIWVTGLILADVFQRQPLTNQSESCKFAHLIGCPIDGPRSCPRCPWNRSDEKRLKLWGVLLLSFMDWNILIPKAACLS